jgi:hypothetical protein
MDWYKVQTFKEITKSSQKLIHLNTQSPKVPAWLKLRSTLKFKKTNLQNTFLLAESTKATVGTDSCRGTVPMEPPMSINNGSMRHREPIK